MALIEKQGLIGMAARVSDARNRSLVGLTGVIVDETKYTLTIKTEKGVKQVPKKGITLELPATRVRIKGERLLGRQEERIKKRSK